MVLGGALVGAVVFAALGFGIAALFQPFKTEKVDRTAPVVLTKISDLAEYHAASGSFEVLVDVEEDVKHVPAAIAGERTFFVGVGNVDAVVDFAQVTPDKIVTSPDKKSVTITVPTPVLGKPALDTDQSHVAARSRGVLNRISGIFSSSPTSEKELYQAAEQKLGAAAEQSELVDRGKENTRKMLEGLLGSLGFENITVVFDAPPVPLP